MTPTGTQTAHKRVYTVLLLRRGALGLFLLLPATLPGGLASAQEAQRWAVVVGVNDYIHFDEGPGGDLRGAERDARSVHEVLVRRWGFPEENTRLLLSREATKDAIRGALTEWAASRVGPDDVLVFYFAGHGAQTFDDDGDEDDGLDETIAPADAGKVSAEYDIRDDELRQWITATGAPEVVVILDSCHSGSATRATGPMRARVLGRPPPSSGVASRAVASGSRARDERLADGDENILEIAAAAPHQSAMEGVFQNPGAVTTFPAGAFTFYLVRRLWQAPPEASYRDLFQRAVSDLKAGHFTQDPQVSGPTEATIFATRSPSSAIDEEAPQPSVEPEKASDADEAQAPEPPAEAGTAIHADEVQVLGVEGDTAVLSGGTERSMTPGSIYGTDSGAVLRIAEVRESRASAEVVQGSPAVGERALLLDAALPDPILAVDVSYLSPELKSAVTRGLAPMPEIRSLDDPEAHADIFLRPSEDERTIEILGRDGGIRGTTPAAGAAGATAERLVEALRKELAIKRLAALENPAAPFTVELEVGGGKRVFHEGDTISFRVRTERAGYLTLVDLGMDGTVTVLHPNGYEDFGLLDANQEVQVPGDWAVFTISEETGLGLVRAIVTPEPLQLSGATQTLLQNQDGARLAHEIRSLLQSQTRNILVQEREERQAQEEEPPAHRWATSLVVYEVVAR